ncbi:hypothetical protein KS4_27680 [Poriferisphaera corsica]|uniref:Uncharacterized protein n=1 Tax=Poriferisphaera corsica TaxID=2528020 RepID=A0A517YWT9_9BACT|nr:SAP domain-containing protein [Poriferisphaera corsica]QDU34694.1 hypothetical protein KS4_27680 [Poriferisphaera corsica]
MSCKLRKTMTVDQFDGNYYYATKLKDFARKIGITVGNFRKIEIEVLIRQFLTTGQVPQAKPVQPRESNSKRDTLTATTTVENYVGNKATKSFLLALVEAQSPGIRNKSGQWYWLNDWRRKQQAKKLQFTYNDLANELHRLMTCPERLPQIPSARMNNFIADYLADPANKNHSRKDAQKAWEKIKTIKGPKTHEAYLAQQ